MRAFLKSVLLRQVTLLVAGLSFLFITPCYGFNVTLEWDENTQLELDHYIVYWGTSSRNYTSNSGDIGNVTNYVSPSLDDNTTYYFVVRAVGWIDGETVESYSSREVCVMGASSIDPGYDRGWAITSGSQKGFKVMYSSSEGVTPTLGLSGAIPPLNLSGVTPLGSPLNLQPSPIYFDTPVKIYIPCPGYSDLNRVNIYHYNDVEWSAVNDAYDWIVANSIEEHYETSPYTIAAKIKHFSGVQAGVPAAESDSSGGGGCFVATAAFGSPLARHVEARYIGQILVNRRLTQTNADFKALQGE